MQPKKNRKKPVPNLKFEVAFGYFLWHFFGFFGLNFDKKFQPFKNHVNNEVSGGQKFPNNTLNAYKAQQMSYKSYFDQQEPLNENPLNQSKLAKMEKPKKNRKKPVPNLKFAVAFGFFGLQAPHIHYTFTLPEMVIDRLLNTKISPVADN